MKRYRAYAEITGGKYLGEVEAESKDKAEEVAWELESAGVSLCHSCSEECEDAEIAGITVEEVK